MNKLYLSYCSICTNRKYSLQSGIQCNISDNKIPDIKVGCSDYCYDQTEHVNIIDKYLKEYENKSEKQYKYHQTELGNPKKRKDLFIPLELKESVKHYVFFHMIPSAIFIIAMSYYLIGGNVPRTIFGIYFSIFMIALFSFIIIRAFLKATIYRKPKITLSVDGILLNDSQVSIAWRDIIVSFIKIRQNLPEMKLVIVRYSNIEPVEFDIHRLDLTPYSIGNIIEQCKEKFNQQYIYCKKDKYGSS